MVNGKTPLYLTLLSLALFGAAMLLRQPYSADWPGTAYAEPAERYIQAALQGDSVRLASLSATAAPVRWALAAGRAHRDSLALWEHRIQAWTGEQRGDTTEVFVYPQGRRCDQSPIIFRFVGTGNRARVLHASSDCLDH
jgi:hypothetical protein